MGVITMLFALTLLSATSVYVLGNVEVDILMEMKASLDPKGETLESWVRGKDPCEGGSFEGVACNDKGRVTNVSLQGKGLSGVIPASVGKLSSLTGLYLHYNALHEGIPREISNLSKLIDLYLNVNGLSGDIPKELGSLPSLQALQLCCNSLTGPLPSELGNLKNLSVLALQQNELSGAIPASLGELKSLSRIDLSSNSLFGSIPVTLAKLPRLTVLDVSNNSLSGQAPEELKQMGKGFHYGNNSKLCGRMFVGLESCNSSGITPKPLGSETPHVIYSTRRNHGDLPPQTQNLPESADLPTKQSSLSSNRRGIPIILGTVVLLCGSIMASVFTFLWLRRRKQKISSSTEITNSRPSIDHLKDSTKHVIPLISLDYSGGWHQLAGGERSSPIQSSRFNLEIIESATQYFSDKNLLGRNNYCATYRGSLRDGSLVIVKRISTSSCKSEDVDFQEGLKSLYLLRHENVVRLRGYCCSGDRGECFLVYDFIPNGSLLQYLDANDDNTTLDWPSRVKIAVGVARGIEYLHEGTSKSVVHHNISAKKILLDQYMNPLLSGSALHKLLADDIIYSILKSSASMGYLAPEYTTTGRATENTDVYAFGVILLQLLTGRKGACSLRPLMQSGILPDFIDPSLVDNYSKAQAYNLVHIALECTNGIAFERPSISSVIQQLEKLDITN